MILFNVSKRIVSEPFFSCKTPLYEIDRQMINLTCIINLACAEAATGDVLQNRCSSVFCNIHRKAPMLKSLCSVNIVKFSRTVFFIEHLRWLLLLRWRAFKISECSWESWLTVLAPSVCRHMFNISFAFNPKIRLIKRRKHYFVVFSNFQRSVTFLVKQEMIKEINVSECFCIFLLKVDLSLHNRFWLYCNTS